MPYLDLNRHWDGEDGPQCGVAGFIGARERGEHDLIALDPGQHAGVRAQQADGAGHDRIEHRLHVRLRPADDAQDVASGGLRVEGRGQVPVACLQLLEQADVLDSNHRLVGEGLQQLDLVVREGSGLSARHPDDADGSAFPQHRYPEAASKADSAGQRWLLVLRIEFDVGYVDHRALENRPPYPEAPGWARREDALLLL